MTTTTIESILIDAAYAKKQIALAITYGVDLRIRLDCMDRAKDGLERVIEKLETMAKVEEES